MTTKQPAAFRRLQIMNAAVKLAAQVGYSNITRDEVAREAGVSNGMVNKYYSTMPQLRRDVIRHAMRRAEEATGPELITVLRIIAQAIALRDRHALKACINIREQALATLN